MAATRTLSCHVEREVNVQFAVIAKTCTALRLLRNKCTISTVFTTKLGCGCAGLYSFDLMFFSFRLKYVKVSLQYLNKVRLTLQRICPTLPLGKGV